MDHVNNKFMGRRLSYYTPHLLSSSGWYISTTSSNFNCGNSLELSTNSASENCKDMKSITFCDILQHGLPAVFMKCLAWSHFYTFLLQTCGEILACTGRQYKCNCTSSLSQQPALPQPHQPSEVWSQSHNIPALSQLCAWWRLTGHHRNA